MKALFAAIISVGMASTASARMLDLTKPDDIIRAEIKLGCAPDPAKPRLSWMTGKIMARRQGEPDKHIFDVQAINTRACQTFEDATRGLGYRAVTREIMFYLDPATGKIIDTWQNPWTGETVDVIHMFNDPVNMAEPKYAIGKDGKPITWDGRIANGMAVIQKTNNFFRDGPMSGDYQDYVGGKYSVMEASATVIPVASWLETSKKGFVPVVSAWTRISPWLPWMKMAGREGQAVLSSTWYSAGSFDDVPEPARSETLAKFPAYATAPPFDDARPSVNSWNGMKKAIDEKRAK